MILDSRLKAVADFVPINSRVADIGTDHGYLAIELINRGIASHVIASDKNSGPLEAAKNNIKAAELESKIDIRLSDGLKEINKDEVDVIVIAGMGGALICDILNDSPEITEAVNKIILQPMNAVDKVREWAVANDWHIEDEDLAEVDDIIYEIFCLSRACSASKTTKKITSPLLPKFIQGKIDKLQRVVDAMSKSPRASSSEKYLDLQKQIAILESKLKG